MKAIIRQWKASTSYKIHEKLGEGGYSQVYRAERINSQLGLHQTVAIKILKSENSVEMWRKEFASLAKVKSPYCVQVFAFEQSASNPALILEYVDGLNLKDLVQFYTLSTKNCVEILAQIYQGLKDLRSFGLCHGDLSPKNVMVDRDGQVHLLDFGLANTRKSKLAVTPGFIAPEILAKSENPNYESDLYSLGCLGQFMQQNSLSSNLNYQSLLDSDPKKRSLGPLFPNPNRKLALSKAIRAAAEKKQRLISIETKTLVSSNGWRAKKGSRLKNHLLALLFACISSSQPAFSSRATAVGNLSIRTELWHHIELDGQSVGYTPIELKNLTSGSHRLKWRNAKSKGELTFQITQGLTRQFTDVDLHSY